MTIFDRHYYLLEKDHLSNVTHILNDCLSENSFCGWKWLLDDNADNALFACHVWERKTPHWKAGLYLNQKGVRQAQVRRPPSKRVLDDNQIGYGPW